MGEIKNQKDNSLEGFQRFPFRIVWYFIGQGLIFVILILFVVSLFFIFIDPTLGIGSVIILFTFGMLAFIPAMTLIIGSWATFWYRFEENGIRMKVWSFKYREIFLPFEQIEYVEIVEPIFLKFLGMKLILLKLKDSLARLSDIDVAFGFPLLIRAQTSLSLDLIGYFLQKRWWSASPNKPKFLLWRWFPPYSIFFWFVPSDQADDLLNFFLAKLKGKKLEL